MCQDLPDRSGLGDERDEPDVAATVRALERKLLPHPGQEFRPGNPRRVVRAWLWLSVAAAFCGMRTARMPAGRGLAPFADIPDRQRGDGGPELVIWRKHPVIAMPMLPRRRDEIGEPVEELKRRELDDAVGPRPGGLAAAAGPDPGGGFVPGQHVADAGDPAVWAASHGESFEREGGPGAVSEEMFETPKIARHIAIDERDPDTRVY